MSDLPVSNDFHDFNSLKNILQKDDLFSSIQVFSFDVFDTLLNRKLLKQEKSWRRYSRIFAIFRVAAEKIARRLQLSLKIREVTLEQIYRYMPMCYSIDEEIQREKKYIEIDFGIEELILQLQKFGKRILLISDTYYSESNLRYFLENAKFDLDAIEIFVSSEFGVSKNDGLFSIVRDHLSLRELSWVHIGDDIYADSVYPQACGIKCFLYKNHINSFLKSKILSRKGLSKLEKAGGPEFIFKLSKILQQSQGHLSQTTLDIVSTFIVRPIVRNSIVAIQDSEIRRNSDLLLYCSRDGWMFQMAHADQQKSHSSQLRIEYFKTSRALRGLPDYQDYVAKITKGVKVAGVFDLGWKGSTLKFLESSCPEIYWKGYFLTSTYKGRSEVMNLADFNFFKKVNVLRSREFFEMMFPAPTHSFSKLDLDNIPVPADEQISPHQIDIYRIFANTIGRSFDFQELEIEEALEVLYLLAVYPGSALIEELEPISFSSSGSESIPLVTNSWSKLLSRKKILWTFSARPNFVLPLLSVFRLICQVKEVCQKIPILRKFFIG